ncbi:MAG: hypothetical protein OXH38_11935, partial [Chloroflexi bacterium]|nr:hypothetical protein [Chloroflexota bacterium]
MFGPRIRSWKQFATGVLAGAALVGALAAGLVYGASSGESEARVVALKHEDGRVEVGLQQRDIGGAWGDTQRPDARFLAPNADVGRLYHSSPVALAAAADESITTSLRRADFAALGHAAAQNHQAGAKLICLSLDRYDEGRGAYCDALRDAHPDDVTVYALSNPGEVAALVGANAEALASGASLTTASTQAFVVAREVLAGLGMTGVNVTIPPVSADAVNAGVGRDDLFCLVHHGGPDDIFWGIARGTAWLAAESDRMNLRVVRGATGVPPRCRPRPTEPSPRQLAG